VNYPFKKPSYPVKSTTPWSIRTHPLICGTSLQTMWRSELQNHDLRHKNPLNGELLSYKWGCLVSLRTKHPNAWQRWSHDHFTWFIGVLHYIIKTLSGSPLAVNRSQTSPASKSNCPGKTNFLTQFPVATPRGCACYLTMVILWSWTIRMFTYCNIYGVNEISVNRV